jgi:secreted PhoX family phosphatase
MPTTHDLAASYVDPDDLNNNTSNNPSFETVLDARLSRRSILMGTVGTAATAVFGSLAASAAGLGGEATAAPREKLLGFKEVAKSLADAVVVPAGYTASVLYALGDPLTASTPAYKNDGTDTDFENRAGDHHDGMEWFGLDNSGRPSANANSRGLLAMNFEATTDEKLSSFFLHANGGTSTLPRPAGEVPQGLRFQHAPDAAVRHRDRRTGARQPAAGHQIFPQRHQDPRHAEQLRHRQDALGHLPDRRRKLGRLFHTAQG